MSSSPAQAPPVTDDEICFGLLGGEAVAVAAYQSRTGVSFDLAKRAVREALDDVKAGRREPEEER